MNIAHRIARLTAAFASVAACAFAAPAFASERIPQIAAEDGSYTRQIDADDGITSASPGQICEPGAKWIRLGFKDLALKGYDSLTVSGDGGSSYTFEGDKWDGVSFSSRAIEGECVQIKAYFADPASHYSLDSYQYGVEPLNAGSYVVVAAGDICSGDGNQPNGAGSACKATSDTVIAINPLAVLTAGDNTYENGALSEFTSMYDPSWGRFKSIIEPAPGNHEYGTSGATGYFDYFNGSGVQTGQAGDRSKGYYSWNLGSWHFISLNSSSGSNPNGPDGNEQAWLAADLAANTLPCVAAYWHHPVASDGNYHPGIAAFNPWWNTLVAAHADLIINGHDHNYQRYPPMSAFPLTVDETNGAVEVLVGTGGRYAYPQASSNHPAVLPVASNYANSAANNVWGVLKLTLTATGYDGEFVPSDGTSNTFTDTFSGTCHMAPHKIGGSAAGVAGSGLKLHLAGPNSTDDLTIASNGSFTFNETLNYNDAYTISIAQQPSSPVQTCALVNASGTVQGADIGNVQLSCTTRTWNVSTGATGQGTIDPPTAIVNDEATQAFTLTPATGYHIDAVNGCGGTLNASTYTTGQVTADCAIAATFAIDTYTLSYSTDGTGTISGTPVQTVDYGSSGTAVTAVPNAHYHFVQWSDGVQTATRTDSNVTANLSVAATFAIDSYTLTYAAGANGSISGAASQTIAYGASGLPVTAVGSTGYHFTQWSDGSTANPRTDANVSGDLSVSAAFALNTYTVGAVIEGGQGTITPDSQTISQGATASFTLLPAAGYHVDTAFGCGGTLGGSTFTTDAITADCAVHVLFAIDTHTVGTSIVAGTGTISPSAQTVDYGTTATFTLAPATGNHIESASGCGGALDGSTYTTGEVSADCTVSVSFALDQVAISATVEGGHGTVTPDTQMIAYGADATFTLTPDPGYVVDVIGGTCPAGTLNGGVYTVPDLTSACSLTVSFAVNSGEVIFESGFEQAP